LKFIIKIIVFFFRMYFKEKENSNDEYYQSINDRDTFLKVNSDCNSNSNIISNKNNENDEGYIQSKISLGSSSSNKQGKLRKKVTQACEK